MTDGQDSETPQERYDNEVKTGEQIMVSAMTGNTYRVTKWVDKGDGKAVALEKELVDDG